MMIKKWELSVLIALIFTTILSMTSFYAQCGQIRKEVLRLHILANSDSEQDQQLKLKVRDRLLNEGADIFAEADSVKQAEQLATENIDMLTSAAEDEIRQNGYDYPVKIEVAPSRFNTRHYDDVTLPAGEYEAVRVLIGDAAGKNWWCVMYPSMCLPAASQRQDISTALNDNETEIVSNYEKYEVKFKTVEIYEQIKAKLGF